MQMSLLTVPLASLVFFSSLVVAQIIAPTCHPDWKWSYNGLNQNPCTVAVYLISTCNKGGLTPIEPLAHEEDSYHGPDGVDNSNLCKCNTVAYSLMMACGGCQGGNWISWSEYSHNCTKPLPPSSFPNPVPEGTRVPNWALLDPTLENYWNYDKSYAAGGTPELYPGTIRGPSSGQKHGSKGGAIAGGIFGTIAAVSIIVAALLYFRRRQRSLASSAADAGGGALNVPMGQSQRPMSGQGVIASSFPRTATSPTTPYNPYELTSFSGIQGAQKELYTTTTPMGSPTASEGPPLSPLSVMTPLPPYAQLQPLPNLAH